MSYYWAIFKRIGSNTFRFDTRIYINEIGEPRKSDPCIGAVVGKNPGSANPSDITKIHLQEIILSGDKLLPSVKNIIQKSYNEAKTEIPSRGFIQVLNLFYLCNTNLERAIEESKKFDKLKFCQSEQNSFPWIWYVWGNSMVSINKHKNRFNNIKAKKHFFFNQNTKRIDQRKPTVDDFARHTQGLKQNLVVPFISQLIKNG